MKKIYKSPYTKKITKVPVVNLGTNSGAFMLSAVTEETD
jgi:hypothetical protein